ncbi:MAG: (2Fe-2S)-binding protein [Methylococcales bacterium]|nr:(2Fe-2S)-binding protein [Methylococcales bacterium]
MFKQLPFDKTTAVHLMINNQPVTVAQGTTVAAAALSHGLSYTRTTAVSGAKRAPFCMMGVCFECLMVINGQPNQRGCGTYVEEGMQVETQQGAMAYE